MQEDSGAAMLTYEGAGPGGAGPPGPAGRVSTDRDGAGTDATPDWQKQLTNLVAGQKNIMQTIKKNQSDMTSYIGNEVKKSARWPYAWNVPANPPLRIIGKPSNWRWR